MPRPPDDDSLTGSDYGHRRMTRHECAALVDAANEHVRALNRHTVLTEWPLPSRPWPEPELPLISLTVVDDDWRERWGTSPACWTHRFVFDDRRDAIMRLRNFVRYTEWRGVRLQNQIALDAVEWAGWRKPCPIDHPDYIPAPRERASTPEQKFRVVANRRALRPTRTIWKEKYE